jgi:hypothetical protein
MDLAKYNISPPPMRELASRAARRKSGMTQTTKPVNQNKSPGMHQFQASDKNGNNGTGGQGDGDKDDDLEDEDIIARQSIAAVQRRETQHWGQLSDLIRSEQLAVKVYMPDRKPLEVLVEPTAMATDVVMAALVAHKKNTLLAGGVVPKTKEEGGLDYDHPELYCLMMHDGDGLPDDMAVPGDRSMGDLNETEVVIVPKVFRTVTDGGDAQVDDDDAFDSDDGTPYSPPTRSGRAFSVTPLKDMGDDPDSMSSGSGWSRRNSTTAHPELVSVTLPDQTECKVLLQGHWRAADLIAEVSLKRKHRIAVLSREYELHVLWLDQDRLRWQNTVVGPDVKLVELQVTELELKPRIFMDQPRIKMPGAQVGGVPQAAYDPRMGPGATHSSNGMMTGGGMGPGGGGAGGGGANSKSAFVGKSAEEVYELMYVVQTAEMLEEWDIVKTNRWGKRQKRVIGVGKDTYDQEYKIYNKKRDDVNKSRITDSVARSARLLKQVLGVRQMIPDKPRFFTITYRDEKDKPQEVCFEVPLSSDAPKKDDKKSSSSTSSNSISSASGAAFNGSFGDSLMGEKLKEQEKEAAEQCLRIVAKILFLLDLQRQRSQRQKARTGSVEDRNDPRSSVYNKEEGK